MLEHLHSRGVAYRYLLPDNILVQSRSPLRVRFTDFGLASDRRGLKTLCGTEQYAAPEIFTGESYTAAVDIWSLGVIVLEYVYGLPTQRSHAHMGGRWRWSQDYPYRRNAGTCGPVDERSRERCQTRCITWRHQAPCPFKGGGPGALRIMQTADVVLTT